jgi:hypothetical protein
MSDIKNIIEIGLKLESDRRQHPFDDNGMPLNFDVRHKEYTDFLTKYGWILLTNLERIQNENSYPNRS